MDRTWSPSTWLTLCRAATSPHLSRTCALPAPLKHFYERYLCSIIAYVFYVFMLFVVTVVVVVVVFCHSLSISFASPRLCLVAGFVGFLPLLQPLRDIRANANVNVCQYVYEYVCVYVLFVWLGF